MVSGRGPLAFWELQRAERHPLVDVRRLPRHPDLLVLRCDLRQHEPGLHVGRVGNEPGVGRLLHHPADADERGGRSLSKYDKAPYTTQPGSIPFLDIDNKYISVGSGYTPQVLQGLSMTQIAAQLNDKNSAVATAIDGEANRIVAAITAATGVQPDSATATGAAAPAATPTTAVGS